VILAVEAQNYDGLNQIDFDIGDGGHQAMNAKMKLNIDQASGSSSSTSSSNNLKYGSASSPSTL